MAALFTRIDDGMHKDIKSVAALGKVSVRELVEVVLSERMGREHPLSPAVRKAFQAYKKQHSEGEKK